MKQIDIYINTKMNGKISEGIGKIHIVLETEWKGKTYAINHMSGWKKISMQRLQARAMEESLGYLKEKCEVNIHINSLYVEHMDKKEQEGCANEDIWKRYWEQKQGNKVTIIREKTNKYSEVARSQMEKEPIKMKEDNYV